MNQNSRYLGKNLILFSISTFGSKIISFLLVPLYTNYLSTSEYGGIDLVNTLLALTLPVLTFSLESAVLRFCLDDSYQNEQVISTALHIWIRGIIFNIILSAILFSIGVFKNVENFYLYYHLLFLAQGTKEILLSIYRGTDKVKIMVESSLINSFTLCLLNILFLTVFNMGVPGYVLAFVLSSLISIVWGCLRAKIHFSWNKYDKIINKDLLFYGGPLIFNQIGWWMNNSLDKYVVLYYLGLSSNGIYSIAYKIPTIMSVFSGIFSNAWSLSAIKTYGKEDASDFATRMYKIYNSFLVLACSALLIMNVPIARILFAREFFEAWKITGVLIIATSFNGLSGFLGSFFSAAKDTKSYAVSTITGGLVNFLVSILLVNTLGILGVALGTLVSYISIWAIRFVRSKRYIQLDINIFFHILMYILLGIECWIGRLGFDVQIVSLQIVIFIILVILNYSNIKVLFTYFKNLIHGGKNNGKTSD